MSSDVAVRLDNVGKRYQLGGTAGFFRYRSLREDLLKGWRRGAGTQPATAAELWALRHVDLSIAEGETIGIIGHNGAGKSTLFKVLAGITPPTEGRAQLRGRVGSLLEVGTGFHPELSGRENIFLSGAVLGMRRAEIIRKLDEIVEFAGVSRFLDTPVKRFSSGMYMRLAFAVAAHLEPEILLVDEVLSVGDAQFQKKCLGKMAEVGRSGRTVLFVSHSMPAIARLCTRVVLLERGEVVADGAAGDVVRQYLGTNDANLAAREWSDPASAPGDEFARLEGIRIRNGTGSVSAEHDIREPVTIEVSYQSCKVEADNPVTVYVELLNDDGLLILGSADFNNAVWRSAPRQPGRVVARCRIPGNFLAEGTFFVSVHVVSLSPPQTHAVEREAVSFHVVDRSDGDGVRGHVTRDWPGVVRPMLDWDVSRGTGA